MFRVQGSGFRVAGFRVSGFRVSGFQGSGLNVPSKCQDVWFRVREQGTKDLDSVHRVHHCRRQAAGSPGIVPRQGVERTV